MLGATSILFNALHKIIASSNAIQGILGMGVVMAVLHLEVTRRVGDQPQQRHPNGHHAGGARSKIVRRYAPEALALTACLSVAVLLRVYGSIGGSDEAALASIMRQWPILITADSLLALQAMLRVLVLLSAVMRTGGSVLFSQETAAISCGAALGRAALVVRSVDYRLDGPVAVGGHLPAACEIFSFVLLAYLCRNLRRKALVTSLLTLAVAAWIGYRNRLKLADDVITDGLFVFAHTAEMIAAFSYLSRALFVDAGVDGQDNVALRFGHLVMPVQQCMAAYYFVQAFEYVPQLVAAGSPFEVLQIGGLAQVGAYLAAAILHLAEYLEAPSAEPGFLDHAVIAEVSGHEAHSTTAAPRRMAVRSAF